MNGRDKRRVRAVKGRAADANRTTCPNCGEKGHHFVPPSLGQVGFYSCGVRPGCCTSCKGTGGNQSGPCWDCRATGHAHPDPEDCTP